VFLLVIPPIAASSLAQGCWLLGWVRVSTSAVGSWAAAPRGLGQLRMDPAREVDELMAAAAPQASGAEPNAEAQPLREIPLPCYLMK